MSRISFILYIMALVMAPLFFGTCETWSISFMESTVFTAALLFFLSRYRDHSRPLRETPGILFFILVPVFFLLQLIPMPGSIVKFVSPKAYELYEITTGQFSTLGWLSITMDKKATFGEFFRYSSYAAIYFLTVQLTANRHRLTLTIKWLVFTAALIAILAVVQKATANGLIYWFRPAPGNNGMGPYIYHNHFAGYMEMILPLALYLFFSTKPAKEALPSLRERFIEFFTRPDASFHVFTGVAAAVIATSIFVSLSRGGIISSCLSLFFLVLILRRKNQVSYQRVLFILVPAITLIFISWFGWEPVIERFLKIRTAEGIHDGRFLIWQDTLPMIKDFLFTGGGAGSFEAIFPAYITTHLFGGRLVDHAHNDYLELLCTIGLAGTILVMGFLFSIIRVAWNMISKRYDPAAIYLWAASLSGIIAILLHSITDFNLYNGANGLYFFTLCGLLVSSAATRMNKGDKSLLPDCNLSKRQVLLPITALSLLFLSGLYVNIRSLSADSFFHSVKNVSLNSKIPRQKLVEMKSRADLAVKFDPLESRNYYLLANIESSLQNNEAASLAYQKAIALQPLKGEYLQQYGVFLSRSGNGIDPEPLMRAATLINPADPDMHIRYGNWLIDRQDINRGLKQMKTGLTLDPRRLTGQAALLVAYGFKGKELQEMLPDGTSYQLKLGNILEQFGKLDEATSIYQQAETRLKSGATITAENYRAITAYYTRQKMYDDALRVARQGTELFPDDLQSRIVLGDTQARNGLPAEAMESFLLAVSMAPTDIYPQIKLAAFSAQSGNTDRAEQEYRKCVELLPRSKSLRAWHIRAIYKYYYTTGRFDQALAVINTGIQALPGNPEVKIILGDAYLQMGRKLDARVEYQRVLTMYPDNEDARQSLKKLGVSQ